MTQQILVAGGGIGGLAAALACLRKGCEVRLYEQADAFSEVGAGIQLGPNVVRVLQGWGLGEAVAAVAAFPQALCVRDARSGDELGRMTLGESFARRYDAPYATIHRADLQQLLLHAVEQGGARLYLRSRVERLVQDAEGVTLEMADGRQVHGDALVGADGLWSRVRAQLLDDGPPRVSGHLAYRALVRQDSLPAGLRSHDVTLWLGERLHVVHYPVRSGDWLNVVAVVHGRVDPALLQEWDHDANAAALRSALGSTAPALDDLVQAVADWRLWPLCDRPPMTGPQQHAVGRVALLGDAAHPMRPYLAQGAGMAIEDAAALGQALSRSGLEVSEALGQYAHQRWQRNARVQAQAVRNGEIFHASGLQRHGRNWAMRLLGERLLDQPWLYGSA